MARAASARLVRPADDHARLHRAGPGAGRAPDCRDRHRVRAGARPAVRDGGLPGQRVGRIRDWPMARARADRTLGGPPRQPGSAACWRATERWPSSSSARCRRRSCWSTSSSARRPSAIASSSIGTTLGMGAIRDCAGRVRLPAHRRSGAIHRRRRAAGQPVPRHSADRRVADQPAPARGGDDERRAQQPGARRAAAATSRRRSRVPGDNCWCVERADRFRCVQDAADYFRWVRRRRAAGAPHGLHRRLGHPGQPRSAARTPTRRWPVRRRVSTRCSPSSCAGVRSCAATCSSGITRRSTRSSAIRCRGGGWAGGCRAKCDSASTTIIPVGGSHHQKIVVVDDAVAFCGGIDLTGHRWDTCAHRIDEPARTTATGKPYGPYHEVQAMLSGPAAARLGALVRDRWRAVGEEPRPPQAGRPRTAMAGGRRARSRRRRRRHRADDARPRNGDLASGSASGCSSIRSRRHGTPSTSRASTSPTTCSARRWPSGCASATDRRSSRSCRGSAKDGSSARPWARCATGCFVSWSPRIAMAGCVSCIRRRPRPAGRADVRALEGDDRRRRAGRASDRRTSRGGRWASIPSAMSRLTPAPIRGPGRACDGFATGCSPSISGSRPSQVAHETSRDSARCAAVVDARADADRTLVRVEVAPEPAGARRGRQAAADPDEPIQFATSVAQWIPPLDARADRRQGAAVAAGRRRRCGHRAWSARPSGHRPRAAPRSARGRRRHASGPCDRARRRSWSRTSRWCRSNCWPPPPGCSSGCRRACVIALLGAWIAAAIGYLAGRAITPANLSRWMTRRAYRSVRQLGAHGIGGVVILRLVSIASAGSVHLLCGAARVPFAAYMAGSLIGLTPVVVALSDGRRPGARRRFSSRRGPAGLSAGGARAGRRRAGGRAAHGAAAPAVLPVVARQRQRAEFG